MKVMTGDSGGDGDAGEVMTGVSCDDGGVLVMTGVSGDDECVS